VAAHPLRHRRGSALLSTSLIEVQLFGAERTCVEGGSAGLIGGKRAGLGAVDLSGADLREMDLETADLTEC